MERYTATMLNCSLALGAYAVGGLLWAAVVFLGVAVIRLALELQRLRHRETIEAPPDSQPASRRAYFNDTGFREARPSQQMERDPMTSRA